MIYQNPDGSAACLCRASAQCRDRTELFKRLIEVSARSAVLMSESEPGASSRGLAAAVHARILSRSPNLTAWWPRSHRTIRAYSSCPTPGCRAGKPGSTVTRPRCLKGNGCQRVIPLQEPGRHRVEMWYEPPGLAAASCRCRFEPPFLRPGLGAFGLCVQQVSKGGGRPFSDPAMSLAEPPLDRQQGHEDQEERPVVPEPHFLLNHGLGQILGVERLQVVAKLLGGQQLARRSVPRAAASG